MTKKKFEAWEEKHRPRTHKDIIDVNGDVMRMIQEIDDGKLRDCLFSGPPGGGKTTAAKILAKYFLDSYYNSLGKMSKSLKRIKPKFYNASDMRGIDFVRFLKTLITGSGPQAIILDEFDQLTGAAQAALRPLMEQAKEMKSPKLFICTGNFPEKIIEALHSRFANNIYFPKIPFDMIFDRLNFICSAESVENFKFASDIPEDQYEEAFFDFFKAIYRKTEGDMRDIIQDVQKYVIIEGDGSKTLDCSQLPTSFDIEPFLLVLDESIMAEEDQSFGRILSVVRDLMYKSKPKWRKVDFIDAAYDWAKKKSNDVDYILSKQWGISISKYENRLNNGVGNKIDGQIASMISEMSLAKMLRGIRA